MQVNVPALSADQLGDAGQYEAVAYRKAIQAFSDVAVALNDATDQCSLLHLIARKICDLAGASRCSVYLRDEETGLYRGQVGHAGHDIDAEVKRLTAGIPADHFTHEIVETRKPVHIRDALHDPRPIHSTMRHWGVRSMVGVPMVLRDEVIGIIYLDGEDAPRAFSDADVAIAAVFAQLAAVAISQAQMNARLRESFGTVARQNDILRRVAALDDRLTNLVIKGANVREIVQAVSDLTGKSCALYDAGYQRLASAVPPGEDGFVIPRLLEPEFLGHPEVVAALEGIDPVRSTVVGPIARAGLLHRYLVAPVTIRDERWGTLVVMAHTAHFGPLDQRICRRASTMIALDLSAERRIMASEWDAEATFVSGLVDSARDHDDVRRRADFLGIVLDQPHVFCLLSPYSGAPLDVRAVREAFVTAAPGARVMTGATPDGVVVLLPAEPDATRASAVETARATLEAARTTLGEPLAALSVPCSDAEAYPRAYAQVRQVLQCIRAFHGPGSTRVLAADELGAGRLLLMGADAAEADRFVDETLRNMLADSGAPDLLLTLVRFFEDQRSVRRVAAHLDVHENTVRYRLAKIEELTGLPVRTDSDAQLSVQLALLVLHLRGRLQALMTR
ncbi:GAF domain-containing protein [Solirubrobacter ginsenosidimutans]|uniref:GAF domain-containing protein n=1 Tax=Solirubrobacter ginsenosidimutans TaxID=490573 RepID=A0A9X3S1P7_9ACTN|nr:GAF domain-containing protein [Solirubrobacter ginsenosidimutans]MDA0160321.1 GAF domain-containing protein [Solirubrobacter ginsenosidimutans]